MLSARVALSYPEGAANFLWYDDTSDENSNYETTGIDKELAQFLGLSSATYAIKTYIQPLIDKGTIKLQIPDRPSSPNQKYYS